MVNKSINYLVRAALAEDIKAPYLWLSIMPCDSQVIVKIVNKKATKTIWCEIIEASDNFIERYNNNPRTKNISKNIPCLVANEWYRKKLKINKNDYAEFEIKTSKLPQFIQQLMASYNHPDNTVRLAIYLAIWSLVLGVISLFK